MKLMSFAFSLCMFVSTAAIEAAVLTLSSPLDYQVVQRETKEKGSLVIAGELAEADAKGVAIEARITIAGKAGDWQKVNASFTSAKFQATLSAPSGGWHRLEVRAVSNEKTIAEAAVEHVGIGELFVVAGQSNSANHGEEKQSTKTGKIATFNGRKWQLSNDPQPGASGGGGSFLPPFGDAIAQRFDVPVGFIACGIGATSVREWLPKSTRMANPPTIVSNVQQLPTGEWEAKGQIYTSFVSRMKQAGPRGFRAVLWHQGESDANQRDTSRTLEGKLYRQYLEQLIKESRREIGWDVPWFVAQVSYHVPGDEASADIREAQASLWKDNIALQGPDSDALKGELRENGGKGVHFSGPGLLEHAGKWAEKVAPWLESQLAAKPAPVAANHLPTSRTVVKLEGWTLRVDDRLFTPANEELRVRTLRFLENKLADIKVVVPKDRVEKFQTITIVLDLTHGKLGPMQYHPSAGWLKDNGYSPDLARCVHLPRAVDVATARNIREQPWVILHELTHAYHDQFLSFNEPRIIQAYENYKKSGRGEKALLYSGARVKHYGLTNHKEFFAEMTEAYFGVNDFFPFNRAELKESEPEIHAMLREIWEVKAK